MVSATTLDPVHEQHPWNPPTRRDGVAPRRPLLPLHDEDLRTTAAFLARAGCYLFAGRGVLAPEDGATLLVMPHRDAVGGAPAQALRETFPYLG